MDFTEQQMTEVKRLLQSAADETYKTLRMHAVLERLLHELEIEIGTLPALDQREHARH